MPALPSMTTNRPPPLRAASARARSAATWTSRSRSKLVVPPEGTTLAVAITTNPVEPSEPKFRGAFGVDPDARRARPSPALGGDDRVSAALTTGLAHAWRRAATRRPRPHHEVEATC